SETGLLRLAWIIDVPEVDQDLAAKRRCNTLEIECAELVPLGDNDQHVGAVRCSISVIRELDPGEDLLGLRPCYRIECANLSSPLNEGLHDRNRGSLAHVVRVRLEREAEHSYPLALGVAAKRPTHALDHARLPVVIDCHRGPDDPLVDSSCIGGLEK